MAINNYYTIYEKYLPLFVHNNLSLLFRIYIRILIHTFNTVTVLKKALSIRLVQYFSII